MIRQLLGKMLCVRACGLHLSQIEEGHRVAWVAVVSPAFLARVVELHVPDLSFAFRTKLQIMMTESLRVILTTDIHSVYLYWNISPPSLCQCHYYTPSLTAVSTPSPPQHPCLQGDVFFFTFIVDSPPGVGADEQPGSKRVLHHSWIILTDDLDVSGQETNISCQSVGESRTWHRVSPTCGQKMTQTFQCLMACCFGNIS